MAKYKGRAINYPEALLPENLQVLIGRLEDTDNRTVGRLARCEEDRGEFSFGVIKAVKEAIQLHNRLAQGRRPSAKDVRADLVLFEYTSSGRRARRW